jgi:hypothetical protein
MKLVDDSPRGARSLWALKSGKPESAMTELNADIASIIRRSCGHRNDLYQRQVNDRRLTQRVSCADSVALVVGWAISLNGGPSRAASVFKPERE